MQGANTTPTLEDIQAERERRNQERRSLLTQAAGDGQPVTLDAIRAERARREAERSAPAAPARSSPIRRTVENVGRWLTGEGRREEGAGEIAYQSVPERENVRWDNGLLSGVLNALPREARSWLDAQGRANAIGVGFFLDPNEEHRAEIIRHNVPTAQFRRDEHNNLMVRYDEDSPWAYINRPGASVEDAQTLANETMRYLAVRRVLPGGNIGATRGATSPLGTSTVREAVAGGLSTAAGQQAATAVGGSGVDIEDVTVSAAGGAVGNVVGHGVTSVAQAAPRATRAAIDWVADRLPGGAQRAAERQAAAQTLLDGFEQAARQRAAESVRAGAQEANLTGEGLERAIRQAEDDAVQIVREQTQSGAREIDTLARSFGVRLAKAQTEGDIGGMQFLYEAAGGLHGPGAQRAATAFFAAQNRALPQGIRGIIPNPSGISSPEAGVNVARAGMERAYETASAAEDSAWSGFRDAARRIQTYEQTPGGNASGVTSVQSSMRELLESEGIFVVPRAETEAAESLAQSMRDSYPLVWRVMRLTQNMEPATRAEVPMVDIQRVLQIKRYIDDAWDASGDDLGQRRLLSRMGSTVRDWLKNQERHLSQRAPVTAERLRDALGVSQQTARTFRENRLVREIVTPPERGGQPPTDEEVIRRLFGGGRGGLNVGSEGVQALTAMREALGPRSPEWQTLRQAAVQRLTQGLDIAVETNQTPAIITTYNRFNDAFRASREAMEVLFAPDELARLRQAQEILRAMMPTPRNPANPTNSGIVAGRATKGAISALANALRNIPGANIVVGGAQDAAAAARVNVEISGAPGDGFRIARALGSLWDANQNVSGVSGAIGSARENQDNRAFR